MDGGRPVAAHLNVIQILSPAGTAASTAQLREGQIVLSWEQNA